MGAFGAYLHQRKLRFRHLLPLAIALLAALIVLDVSLYAYAERPGGPLHPFELRISGVEWFLEEYLLTTVSGINATAAAPLTVILTFINCELFCGTLNVGTVTTNTSGFAVMQSNLPVSIPPGETGNISVTFSVPGSGYSGPLAVVLGH